MFRGRQFAEHTLREPDEASSTPPIQRVQYDTKSEQ